jgi:hypothetical protein
MSVSHEASFLGFNGYAGMRIGGFLLAYIGQTQSPLFPNAGLFEEYLSVA